jgi:hypothetical protein
MIEIPEVVNAETHLVAALSRCQQLYVPIASRCHGERSQQFLLPVLVRSLRARKTVADKSADKNTKARQRRAAKRLNLNWSHPPGLNRRPADYE